MRRKGKEEKKWEGEGKGKTDMYNFVLRLFFFSSLKLD